MRPLLLALPLLLVACTPWEEPTGTPDLPASVVSTVPEHEDRHVPGTTEISIEWDRIPQDVTITLIGPGNVALPGTVVGEDRSVARRFEPDAPLEPDTQYDVEVTWSNVDGTHAFEFETSMLGFPLSEDDLDELPGATWAVLPVDLTGLDQLPIAPNGPDIAFLLAVHEDSDPESGELHLVLAQTVPGSMLQDSCVETAVVTAGKDLVPGTSDDRPATWDNPDITASGTRFAPGNESGADGTDETTNQFALRDWDLDATVLPDHDGLFIHAFGAYIDTTGLDGLVPENGQFPPDTTFCDLYTEFAGGTCEPCPSLDRESRCLRAEAANIIGEPRGTNLRIRTCADIIDSAMGDFICQGDDARYDADGDGVYELCPEYVPEDR